jgi:dimeric dUTPase (all-alpha-NTP-PPase superfamily)
MNIHDFNSPDEYPVDLLADIFAKQRELAEKYHPIEKANGFNVGEGIEVDLHNQFGQHRIKDFAWRVTEELMEANEAWYINDTDHCQEEVADALHFMVELCLICGMTSVEFDIHDIDDDETMVAQFPSQIMGVVYNLGLACNCLKNKPWKQTQMLTDVTLFKKYIVRAFMQLMFSARSAGIKDAEAMYDLYFRKNKVNQFRQDSKY